MSEVELSVVVTAHDEGVILERTLLNVEKMIAVSGLKSYEVLVHADDANAETEEFLRRKEKEGLKVFWNKFRSLGKSRNFMIEKARGEFVMFLNGDDLVSENWLGEAMRVARNSESLVHPQAEVDFGIHVDAPVMKVAEGGSRWARGLIGKREIFEKVLFREYVEDGGKAEDWFNLDATKNGVKHKVVAGTVYFKRRKYGG